MTMADGGLTRQGPLAGYRVLDLADELGQLAGRLLADLGADVIKVETPRRGDRTRTNGPFYKDQPGTETSLFWWAMNAGKRSVTCALQVEAGRALFHRLVAVSDVVIETSEPGSQQALGLDYATLASVNPRVVVVSISPWGQRGPVGGAKQRSNDLIASAMNGLMHFDPASEETPPWRTTAPQTHVQLNVRAAIATVTALHARGRSGTGQHLDLSLQAVAEDMGARASGAGRAVGRRLYAASDGMVVTPPLGGLTGPQGPSLLDWLVENGSGGDLGSSHWRLRLGGSTELDPADRAVVEGTLERFCATKTRDWLVAEAQKRGAAWTPLHTVSDAVESPQLQARGAWVPVAQDDQGESFLYPLSPWRIDGQAATPPWRAPHVAEHNTDVYVGLLGMDEAELRRLRTRMVV